jgi:hypothetical protein
MPHELILLNPYRFPGKNSLMLGNDDVASFLNGYLALWDPAALFHAAGLPRIDSPYDHEQPTSGRIFAVPQTPPLLLPDDWDERVRAAGALSFRATPDRQETTSNLRQAIRNAPEYGGVEADLLELPSDRTASFFGIGFGHLVVDALFEAMEHEKLLPGNELLRDLQEAIRCTRSGEHDALRSHLQSAAERLLQAREVLYPTSIHVLEIGLLSEQRPGEPLPLAFEADLPFNLVGCAKLLERWGNSHPEAMASLRERIGQDRAEVCGGPYVEREDSLLPLESQLWNLSKGQATYRELLGQEVRVFARKRSSFHPQIPQLLCSAGMTRCLLIAFDDAVLPTYRSTTVNWASPDGKQIEAFTRSPYAADNPQTWFHTAHYLHRTIMQDHVATVAVVHNNAPAAPWYRDWIELGRLAPVLGKWTTFTPYFNEVTAGEYVSAISVDEFGSDYLSERTGENLTDPVTGFVRHLRCRRKVDTCWALRALHRTLDREARADTVVDRKITGMEDEVETNAEGAEGHCAELERELAKGLASRLLAGAVEQSPGYMLLNPCGFARRIALELEDISANLPISGPIKACQREADRTRLVVEVPALGFAWFPQSGPAGTPAQTIKMKLGDRLCVRNEFFEAEIDPSNGCLRTIRDHRLRVNRVGQQIVYNPGSNIRLKEIKVTSTGPALGEVISEGTLVDPYQEKVLATFRQRFRAWLGRPILELRIEVEPAQAVEGYPWHAYFASRFAWGDERMALLRGSNGSGQVTTHSRPMTPEYLEWRSGQHNTILFPNGLPFHQKHGMRMLDVILVPQGETCRTFDLAIGLDREYPMQTALGLASPAPLVCVDRGPPHVGASGWLFHLNAPNLMLTSLRPALDGADALVARILECSTHYGSAELRCVRDPVRAAFIDERGNRLYDQAVSGDCVSFEVAPSNLVQLRVDFS